MIQGGFERTCAAVTVGMVVGEGKDKEEFGARRGVHVRGFLCSRSAAPWKFWVSHIFGMGAGITCPAARDSVS